MEGRRRLGFYPDHPDPPGAPRRPAARPVPGPACGGRVMEGRRRLGFYPDHPDPPGVPGGDAADQPAAADRDEQGVEIRRIGLDLAADGTLAEHRLRLVIGVDRERAAAGDEFFAGLERVGITLAANDQLGAIAANALELGR